MTLSTQVAKHFKAVHFGGNWTDVNVKGILTDLTWEQANTKVPDLNTIAVLVFHINYFVAGVLQVLQGGPLTISDKYSFDLTPITSQQDWEQLLTKTLQDAEAFALLVEQMDETQLYQDFTDKKYGNYYANIVGIIEHTHYHLGQIALIKKLIQSK